MEVLEMGNRGLANRVGGKTMKPKSPSVETTPKPMHPKQQIEKKFGELGWKDKLFIKVGVFCLRKVYRYYGVCVGIRDNKFALFYNNKKSWRKARKLII